MHKKLYQKFEQIFQNLQIKGKVLEIGALPNQSSLLASKFLINCEKVGLSLNKPAGFRDYQILQGNANDMKMFADQEFDCVMCHGVLEHDKYFWLTLSEMNRVLKPGGYLIIGAPAYGEHWFHTLKYKGNRRNRLINFLRTATVCLRIHNYPGDYYRFSSQTFEQVFLAGFDEVTLQTLMLPPKLIGYGRKKFDSSCQIKNIPVR